MRKLLSFLAVSAVTLAVVAAPVSYASTGSSATQQTTCSKNQHCTCSKNKKKHTKHHSSKKHSTTQPAAAKSEPAQAKPMKQAAPAEDMQQEGVMQSDSSEAPAAN